MPKKRKLLFIWLLAVPLGITVMRILIDYVAGREIELLSYSAIFLGAAAAGLIFTAPIVYLIEKSRINNQVDKYE